MTTRFQHRNYTIRRREQIAALASPVRQEIVDMVQASGPLSVAELAGLLGRPADGLYYHVKALAKVGLLVERAGRGVRNGRGRTEAVFAVPGRLRLAYRPKDPENVAGIKRAAAAMLRVTGRTFAEAFDAGLAVGAG